jgi:hypothetical protein
VLLDRLDQRLDVRDEWLIERDVDPVTRRNIARLFHRLSGHTKQGKGATLEFNRLWEKQAAESFDLGLRLLRLEHDRSNRTCALHDVTRNRREKVTNVLEAELRNNSLLNFDFFS